jgi:hypothetical protein
MSSLANSVIIEDKKEETYTWSIPNYSRLPTVTGNKTSSPTFDLCEHKWQLEFYKGGFTGSRDTSILIRKLSKGEVDATLKIIVVCAAENYSQASTCTFSKDSDWGWIHYIPQAIISNPSKGYCINDTLTIRACLEIAFSGPTEVMKYESLRKKMTNLLCDKTIPKDVVFRFSETDEVVGAHRCILMAASPAFLAMFRSDTAQASSGEVDLKDVRPAAMKELVSYIYAGAFSARIPNSFAKELMILAYKYEILDAAIECETILARSITVDSLQDIKEVADACNSTRLKNACVDFACKNCKHIFLNIPFPKYRRLEDVK